MPIRSRTNFMVTSAINGTAAHPIFLAALEKRCEKLGARLLVGRVHYKNPTRKGEEEADQFDPRLVPYLFEREFRPHPSLSIMTTQIAATANEPLPPRMLSLTQDRSAVFAHPQIRMRTVPTSPGRLPKMYYTTGAVTVKEGTYSRSPTGQVGEFHHTLGATIVEVRGLRAHMREVTFDGEGFYDMGIYWTPRGGEKRPTPICVLGDVHVRRGGGRQTHRARFGAGGLIEFAGVQEVIAHDLCDSRACNPHERGNRYLEALGSRYRVVDELLDVREWLESLPRHLKVTVPRSNHDDMIDRYLDGGAWAAKDAELMHWLMAQKLLRKSQRIPMPDALAFCLSHVLTRDVRFLKLGEDYTRFGIGLSDHGHKGPNGAKGSPRAFSQLGQRRIGGHVHSPTILHGYKAVGVAEADDHDYAAGSISGWLTTDCLVFENGKSQLCHLIGGKYHGLQG